jgi:hypothetical protein
MTKPVAILSMVMSLLFMFLGVLIPLRPHGIFSGLPRYMHFLIGFVLIIYGIFRFYRAYNMLKKDQ